jgi:hypothetical protein
VPDVEQVRKGEAHIDTGILKQDLAVEVQTPYQKEKEV